MKLYHNKSLCIGNNDQLTREYKLDLRVVHVNNVTIVKVRLEGGSNMALPGIEC